MRLAEPAEERPQHGVGVGDRADGAARIGAQPLLVDEDRRRQAIEKIDVRTGQVLWQARLGTSVQGFPVSFSIGGRQYIAVTTGLGGGSPRNVPRTIAPDVRHPATGNALYVFALPEGPR